MDNDLGIYVSGDGGVTWNDFNGRLWDATMVIDLVFEPVSKIRAAAHGKGIYEAPLFNPAASPVCVLSFTGFAKNDNNDLSWVVANERNVLHYELERSSNSDDFTKIATVPGRNFSGQDSYTYRDKVSASYFYRLNIIDNDGVVSFSKLVYIRQNNKQEIQVLNNPFTTSIAFKYSLREGGKMHINLYDMSGKLLKREDKEIGSGQAIYTVNGLNPSNT